MGGRRGCRRLSNQCRRTRRGRFRRRQWTHARRRRGRRGLLGRNPQAFTIDRNVINLNNGYVSPAPVPVQDAMRRYLEYSDMGPYHTMVNVL